MSTNDREILNAALRSHFPSFVHRCYRTVNPGARYFDNWHIDAVAYKLNGVRNGQTTRLIVNLPPRSLKSLMITIAFPAWLLGLDPTRKIFCISYGQELAEKHAIDFRAIVEAKWYRDAFPRACFDRFADADAFTTQRGFRRTTSINATLTGLGGDLFIIDDPLKPQDALSEPLRNRANDWSSNTLSSRLDDKRTGAIIVNMQRVHLNDLSGHLLERSDNWEHLSLPAIAETEERTAIGPGGLVHIRQPGEALHPEREPLAVLENLRRELGSDLFAAQYQQAPVPPGGAMIRSEWLRYYDVPPKLTRPTKIIQSWDCAGKTGGQNDWSVCTTWAWVDRKEYYLLDLVRGRYEYPQLRSTAQRVAELFKPDMILIEDTSAGTALAQELRQGGTHPVKPISVHRDKVARLYIQQGKFKDGLVFFPGKAPYLSELEAELLTFPQSKTDDRVDSISQALDYKVSSYDSSYSWVR